MACPACRYAEHAAGRAGGHTYMESPGRTQNVAAQFPKYTVWTVRAGERRRAQSRKFPEARAACGYEL